MNRASIFLPIIILCLLLLSSALELCLCAVNDTQYEACRIPKSCGNQNISFPFYIQDQQESYCGYPGFAITCPNDRPILNLSNSDYVIHEIVYQNQSFRVSNADFSDPTQLCDTKPFPVQNLTIDPDHFQLNPNVTFLSLLYSCEQSVPDKLSSYKVNCSKKSRTIFGFYDGDPTVGNASKRCDSVVEVPVERQKNYSEIGEAMRNGFVMNWTASNCSMCEKSGGLCGFDRQLYHFRCFCQDRPHAWSCNGTAAATSNGTKEARRLEIGLGVGIGGLVVIILILSFYMIRHRKMYASPRTLVSPNNSADNSFGGSNIYFEIPIFSNTELEKATNNFDSSKELGDGGFGTVYHGKLRDGREVAVKRLYEHNYRRVKQFMTEVQILTRLHHKNLVSLYGCTSRHSRELLLVYEYVPNGTVADHLHGDRAKPGSLPWSIRMNIAIETAAALTYLHSCETIHRDVKTSNILLDNNFSVKVGDFGLSRLLPTNVTHVSTAPQGTPGYVDPEYHQCYQLTEKSDVYSFGVVLVELVSSMPAVDITRSRHEINLASFAVNKIQKRAFEELIDPSLGYKSDDQTKRTITGVLELSFRCLQMDREMRPTMDEVLEELTAIGNGTSVANELANRGNVAADVGEITSTRFVASPESDEAGLLKNMRLPPSPISVTHKWNSSSSSSFPSTSASNVV